MKQPKVYSASVVIRLEPEVKRRLEAVLEPHESMSRVGREQIIDLVLERERTKGTHK